MVLRRRHLPLPSSDMLQQRQRRRRRRQKLRHPWQLWDLSRMSLSRRWYSVVLAAGALLLLLLLLFLGIGYRYGLCLDRFLAIIRMMFRLSPASKPLGTPLDQLLNHSNFNNNSNYNNSVGNDTTTTTATAVTSAAAARVILAHAGPCAINLYGLPRQFGHLVLPGILHHIIRVNAPYHCDYYVHYYNRTHEDDYRGADQGRHGVFDPHQVRQLTQAVHDAHHAHNKQQQLMTDRIDHYPVVEYIMDSEESFYEQYQPLLERIFTERGNDGELLYIPHSEKEPFPNATLLNIVKMFHSQQSVWNLMEKGPPPDQRLGGKQKHYSRVAMFRSDLLYMTPIDIYQLPDGTYDLDNQYVVIPNFGRYPVNDRLIVGPWDAVRVWAAQRFSSLARHVRRWPGHGLHSEKMLYYTLFPAMLRDVGVTGVLPAPALCALRVRADAALRFGDCGRDCETWHNQQAVEYLLQRYCRSDISNPNVTFLECHDNLQQQQQQQQKPARDGFPAATWEHCEWKG